MSWRPSGISRSPSGPLARVVQRLGELGHLDVLAPARELLADVVDGVAHDQPERLEAGLLDEEELAHRQVAGEEARRMWTSRSRACCGRSAAGAAVGGTKSSSSSGTIRAGYNAGRCPP